MTMRLLPLVVAAILCGCNGGGGGPDEPPPDRGPDLQTEVPTPTYAADSGELWYFTRINNIRSQLGLGLLAQSAALDLAANNHASYLAALDMDSNASEPEWLSGLEDVQKFGYTGATTQDRCGVAGYTGACATPNGWIESYLEPTGVGPYLGLIALTQGARDIGISRPIGPSVWNGPYSLRPYVQLGYPQGKTPQRQATGFSLVTALLASFHVQINEGETLSVDAFQVTGATGNQVAGQVLTSSNDPLHRVPANAAMFVPTPILGCPNAKFTVHFAGKRDGVPFTLTEEVSVEPTTYCWW